MSPLSKVDEKNPQSSLSFLSLESMTLLVESLAEGVMIIDTDGTIFQINQVARSLHVGGEIPVRGQPLADYSPHDWVEVKKVLATGVPQICALLRLPKATVVVNRMPIMHNGHVSGVVTMMQDIQNFNALAGEMPEFQKTACELETVINQFENVFLSLNKHGIICSVNAAYEKLISMGRQGLIGRHIEDIQRSPAKFISLFREVVESRSRVSLPVTLQRGQVAEGSATPAFDASGDLFRVMIQLKSQSFPDTVPMKSGETSLPAEKPSQPSIEMQRLCSASGFMVHSAVMNGVVKQALKVSKTSSCVLLTGESGTGKTMLASLIHNNSNRSHKPFVVINCGAIPDQLLESELFGYEKGAFTGASSQGKRGLIETANTGTLFLDEIGELQYSLQSKLLEVFEKKSFIRVGGTRRTSVDIRILAATNKNLAEEVEKGKFRRDLFYRLNVIPIAIPPLRERPDDVRAMIDAFVSRYNEQNNTRKFIAPELQAWLLRYPFHGNVRELVNIMEWLLVMSEGDRLSIHDLPVRLQQEYELVQPVSNSGAIVEDALSSSDRHEGEAADRALADNLSLKAAIESFERTFLEKAMQKHSSIQAMSGALDVHFSTLWRKLVKYGLVQNRSSQENNNG